MRPRLLCQTLGLAGWSALGKICFCGRVLAGDTQTMLLFSSPSQKVILENRMRAHGGNEASGGIAVHSGWCGAFPETYLFHKNMEKVH